MAPQQHALSAQLAPVFWACHRASTLNFNKSALNLRSSDNDKLTLLAFLWTQHVRSAPQSRYPCHRPRVARFLLSLCSFF
jgi:hypothetical protein